MRELVLKPENRGTLTLMPMEEPSLSSVELTLRPGVLLLKLKSEVDRLPLF